MADTHDKTGDIQLGENYEQRDVTHGGKATKDQQTRYKPYASSQSEEFKLFITNLPFDTDDAQLVDHVTKAGNIVSATVFRNPSGSSRGMGVVVYENAELLERAVVELNGTEIDGRAIFVRKYIDQHKNLRRQPPLEEASFPVVLNRPNDRPRPPANPASTVYVNNLDYSCTWQHLKDAFKAAGKVIYCEIQVDKEGKSKGMGSVQFERPIEALNAIALFHGQMFFNRGLMVRMDNRSPIKPDPMTVKQVLGGSHLPAAAGTQSLYGGNNVMGLSASLGLSPELLRSLGVTSDSYGSYSYQYPVVGYDSTSVARSAQPDNSYTSQYYAETQPYTTQAQSYTTQTQSYSTQAQPYTTTQTQSYTTQTQSYSTQAQPYTAQTQTQSYATQSYNSAYSQAMIQQQQMYLYTPTSTCPGQRIIIKNLNYRTPWQRLKDLFRQAGKVQFVDILQGADGRPNGNACVLFDTPEAASTAVSKFNDTEVDGRKIEVIIDSNTNNYQ